MAVYITDLAYFLPNAPVGNDQMEHILGMINEIPSRTRRIILRNNRIQQRHYAIDPATGELTHNNAQMTAEAIRRLKPLSGASAPPIACLACGTASPDQFLPGHASMVHGELGCPPCEVASTTGVCTSGMTSMKYAFMNVAAGLVPNAVATGSELVSSYIRAAYCGASVSPEKSAKLEEKPILAFDSDFLRWMLSDGAGAAYLAAAPASEQQNLRIDWIELTSFANLFGACMYAGAIKNEDGALVGWREMPVQEAVKQNVLTVKQDVKLLNAEVCKAAIDRTLPPLIDKYGLKTQDITWFVPHYSSHFFRKPLGERLDAIGFPLPFDKWYSNLATKGNTGAASIYIILAEMLHNGILNQGDRLLCMVPESGRFAMCYMHLTVV